MKLTMPKIRPNVVTVGTAKGGAMKTTTVLGLAEALAALGLRVAVVDLDDGATATEILEPADLDVAGSKELLNPAEDLTIDSCLTETSWSGVFLCQAEGALKNRQRDLERSSDDLSWIQPRFKSSTVDVVLIDTPPTSGWLGLAGVIAANHVIVPIQPTLIYAGRAIQLTDDILPAANRHTPKSPAKLAGMIVTAFEDVLDERRVIDLLDDRYGNAETDPDGKIWRPFIRSTTAVRTAYESFHQPLRETGNRYARRAADAYDEHAATLARLVGADS